MKTMLIGLFALGLVLALSKPAGSQTLTVVLTVDNGDITCTNDPCVQDDGSPGVVVNVATDRSYGIVIPNYLRAQSRARFTSPSSMCMDACPTSP